MEMFASLKLVVRIVETVCWQTLASVGTDDWAAAVS